LLSRRLYIIQVVKNLNKLQRILMELYILCYAAQILQSYLKFRFLGHWLKSCIVNTSMRYVQYCILYSCPLKNTAKFWTSITEIFYLSPLQKSNLKFHSNFIWGVKFPQQRKFGFWSSGSKLGGHKHFRGACYLHLPWDVV